ncbi:MAG: DUF2795 domain-containing protein [Chloroflexi bacterium]|nr:DUF2795 domain-containing protein [Chloroflexota bacterium]
MKVRTDFVPWLIQREDEAKVVNSKEVTNVKEYRGASPARVAEFLSGINFPCSKNDLISHARRQNAPEEVLETLQKIPERTYNSLADVMSGVGKVE